MKKERQFFVCLDEVCGEQLELVAKSDVRDGGVCGDAEYDEYYRCSSCEQTYKRTHMTLGDFRRFSYEENQQYLYRCDSIPESAKRR